MGGRNGMMPDEYAALSDRQIICLLQIKFDEDGRLITEAETATSEDNTEGLTGKISRAGRELQSPENLGVSEGELQWALSLRPNAVTVHYLSLFWSVWQRRGKTPEEIRELWAKHLTSSN
jgi:hypothetical protein